MFRFSPLARPSRPSQDADWTDQDHYYDGDLSEESCLKKWNHVHHGLDEIQVNGAIRRHWSWSKGKEEVRQDVARTRKFPGNNRPHRIDLTEHFYDQFLPLFGELHCRFGRIHRKFLQFFWASKRLSTKNCITTAKLYDKKHPQPNIDD